MKIFGKVIICIVVILLAIGTAYLIHNNQTTETNSNNLSSTNTTSNNQNTNNEMAENNTTTEIDENKDYIGEEENQEEVIENKETENEEVQEGKEEQEQELTGKEKAIDIVKKKYAMEGQTVKFDHMEGESYVIKINDGTAVTWYLVDGITWEAEEY